MGRIAQLSLFLSIVIAVDVGVHFFLWMRLVRDPGFGPPYRAISTGLVIALALSLPLSFGLGRLLPLEVARVLMLPAYVWMGLMLYLFLFLLVFDFVRLLGRGLDLAAFSGELLAPPGRQLLIARLEAGLAVAAALVIASIAIPQALGTPTVVRTEVRLARLPAAFDGFRIAQLTDLHLGPTLGKAWLEQVVEETRALEPDLVAITGDLVDASVEQLGEAVSALQALKPLHGVFFVTGNHEFYAGWPPWRAFLEGQGIRLLENRRVAVERDSAGFDLAGVEDFDAHRMEAGGGPDLAFALSGRDPTRELVLLSHQVRIIDQAAEHDVGLVLSGHNHGGQIWPWSYMVYLQQPFLEGLHRRGRTQAYISQGTGFWGPPMRLGTQAEISLITLRAGA